MRGMLKSAFGPAATSSPSRSTAISSASVDHVRQNVGDVDHRLAGIAQFSDQREEPLGLACGQRRRRLVEDDDLGVELQSARSLDQLALAGRKAIERRVRREIEAHLLKQLACPRREACAVDERKRSDATARKVRQKNVLGDRQIGEEIELLMDEGDAVSRRLGGIGRRVRRASQSASCRRPAARRPPTMFMSVDLPAPFWPISPSTRPRPSESVTSRTAWMPAKALDISSSSRIVLAHAARLAVRGVACAPHRAPRRPG